MTDRTFDPARPLVMAQFRTVLGHGLNAGTALTVTDEPSAAGEVDEALARRLWNGGLAMYADEARPTPVETPEQEQARLATEASRSAETDAAAPTARRVRAPRGQAAVSNSTNSESGQGPDQGDAGLNGSDAGAGGAGGASGDAGAGE